ncbi:hypothetical protein SAMN05660826_00748 [Caldanaerovirga acetigignens]|jgi:type II secretory pathway pseudopilin PulG|uniref:Prepilin-type N-terminal cleavage/methylation domain-containing protein n=1 Tax=Caldanaerovirga acetigignens TaxID=447595 RepID=A0A1M7HQI2_9FIRM|nr:hypothetical protein [Caldanaerovirga acetigignens]SHM30822.1 hypothetical protein SAMN05660826_00748 [Caldanaerovirga acetigignens]
MNESKSSRAAFALIEVVVALSVFTLVVGAALTLYQQSILTWKRDEARFDVQEELKYALECMSRDIMSAVEVIDLEQSKLHIKVIPQSSASQGIVDAKEVIYEWDSAKEELIKIFEGKREVLAKKVTGFEVGYYNGNNIATSPENVRRIEIALTARIGISKENKAVMTLKTSAVIRAFR